MDTSIKLDKYKFQCTPLKLFNSMQSNKIEYLYLGEFKTSITDSVLSLAELNLTTANDNIKLRKRVYFILVEGLQNITRHQQYEKKDASKSAMLIIQRFEDKVIITTANYISNSEIPELKQRIDTINSLSAQELKHHYRKVLAEQYFSPKGGAGLGLIEIARKSGNKLFYSFERVNDKFSIFYLQTIISVPSQAEHTAQKFYQSLNNIKILHQYLIHCNIVLSLSGIFIQDKLVYMLSLLEKRFYKNVLLRSKLFNIIVELLQNIVRHADDYKLDNISGHYGIFYIAENDKYFFVTTGNYIRKEKIKQLKDYLEYINSLSIKELIKLHYDVLKSYVTSQKNKQKGLGLIDIRIKTKEKINFYFDEVDQYFAFFSIEVKIKKFSSRIKDLKIPRSKTTPEIFLSAKSSKFIFKGPCYPINAAEFFKPVIDWLKEYAQNPRNFSIFKFYLTIINSSSLKELTNIMQILSEINKENVVIVKWYYTTGDESIFEIGQNFKELFPELTIELIEQSDDNE